MNEFARTALMRARIPTQRRAVSVFAVPLHRLMTGLVTTGNQERRESEACA